MFNINILKNNTELKEYLEEKNTIKFDIKTWINSELILLPYILLGIILNFSIYATLFIEIFII